MSSARSRFTGTSRYRRRSASVTRSPSTIPSGGIIGHQIGGGSGKRFATAVGTLVGAQIGHEAVNGHGGHASREVVEYREHCETRHRVNYEQVIDGYDVTYKYRGKRYHVQMPYNPGERIKLRVEFTPVF